MANIKIQQQKAYQGWALYELFVDSITIIKYNNLESWKVEGVMIGWNWVI